MDAETTLYVVFTVGAIIRGLWSQAHNPETREHEAAAREKERLDPVPRSYVEHLLRRQLPGSDTRDTSRFGDSRPLSGAAPPHGARPESARWFSTSRGRIRVEAYAGLGGLLVLVGITPATVWMDHLFADAISGGVAIVLSVVLGVAAITLFLACAAIYMEVVLGTQDDEGESESEVARIVSGRGLRRG